MKKNKFVIVGAGSSYTPAIVAVLLARRDDLKLQEIALYDIDADRVARTGRFCELYAREHAQGVQVSYTTEIETAFRGADFLFVQIRPGCNQQREQDEKIPLRHGILGDLRPWRLLLRAALHPGDPGDRGQGAGDLPGRLDPQLQQPRGHDLGGHLPHLSARQGAVHL